MTRPNGDDYTPTLPGFEIPPPPGAAALTRAVRATVAALDEAGLIENRHAALVQLAFDLAESVSAAKVSRRATAVALAARELREVLAALPEPEVVPDDEWERFSEALAAAARGDTA